MAGTLPREIVGAIVDQLRAGQVAGDVAAAAGVSRWTVYRYGAAAGLELHRGRPRPSRRRAAVVDAVVPPAQWSPLCMTDGEWSNWQRLNPLFSGGATRQRADRPCADCPLGYAAEMRAVGRCNGTPAGVQDDEEEPAMQLDASPSTPARAVIAPGTRRTEEVDVALDLPCPGCIHREVCRIREGLEARLAKLPVLMPELDEALSVKVDAKVDCALFRPERPAKRGGLHRAPKRWRPASGTRRPCVSGWQPSVPPSVTAG